MIYIHGEDNGISRVAVWPIKKEVNKSVWEASKVFQFRNFQKENDLNETLSKENRAKIKIPDSLEHRGDLSRKAPEKTNPCFNGGDFMTCFVCCEPPLTLALICKYESSHKLKPSVKYYTRRLFNRYFRTIVWSFRLR